MNPNSSINPRAALESSLTALLLGELPHEQAAALHHKLAQDADLANLYERLKHTINLVRETLATPAAQTADQPTPLKLSNQRREKLLQHFKTVTPKEFIPPRRRAMPWLVPVGIAAAFVVILGGLFLPALTKSKTRSQSLAFGTWSRSEPTAPALPAGGVVDSASHFQDPNGRLDQLALKVEERSGGTPIKPSLQQAAPPAKPASAAIVLPQATELANAVSTPASLYYDSPGRSGGMGGGGGFGGGGLGGSGGRVRGNTFGADGRQIGPAADGEGFRVYAYGTPLPSPAIADTSSQAPEYKADSIIPPLGLDGQPLPSAPQSHETAFRRRYGLRQEAAKDTGASTGAGSPARQYPNNANIGDAYFSTDPESRRVARVANVEASPRATVPALSTTLAPAQEALREPAASQSAPGSALAPADPASVVKGLEAAGVPLQALGRDKKATELTAGLRDVVTGDPALDAIHAGALLLKSEAPGLDNANKFADAGASIGKSTGFYDLQNAAPQDVRNNLPNLFQRKNVRQQNNDQKPLGFDSYAGNGLVSNGRLAAQDGTAPSEVDHALIQGKKPEPLPPGEPAAPGDMVPLAIQLPAPAFKGMPRDVPVLGDMPQAGRLFRSTPGVAGGGVEANPGPLTTGRAKNEIISFGLT
jgi:anti-sigma factor RsiW